MERLQFLVKSLVVQTENEIDSNENNVVVSSAAPRGLQQQRQQHKPFSPPAGSQNYSMSVSQPQSFQFQSSFSSFGLAPQQQHQMHLPYQPQPPHPFAANSNNFAYPPVLPFGDTKPFTGQFPSLSVMQQQQRDYQSSAPPAAQGVLLSTGGHQSMNSSGSGCWASSSVASSDMNSFAGSGQGGSRQVSSQGCSRVFIVKGRKQACMFILLVL
jgi:hypothetical protein